MSASPSKLLEVRGLKTYFDVEGRTAKAVDGVSFHINENEVFGLVGESGSGKSVTALSILRLIPNPPGWIEAGEIIFRGKDLLPLPFAEMRRLRGNQISMIFQEPMTALNPVFTVGFQFREAIQHHRAGTSKAEANRMAGELLEMVGVPDGARRLKNYPHQFSGGQRQRIMIAMALALKPSLLIADEPTTALDVTIQSQILDLMLDLREETGHTAILLITHDLAVVAETCERVAVMYGGKIQEISSVEGLFERPLHPYTRGLLRSLPRPDRPRQRRLETIPGIVPSILDFPPGCKFWTRCPEVQERCKTEEPEMREVAPGRFCRCHLVEPGSLDLAPGEEVDAEAGAGPTDATPPGASEATEQPRPKVSEGEASAPKAGVEGGARAEEAARAGAGPATEGAGDGQGAIAGASELPEHLVVVVRPPEEDEDA
ncbi:MAG: ABC transporter ATP-binding protein [Planctomycetota bacterium]|nr:MAG: ABC transporter ATP-binding protein [Planctomycetota bacterium]